METWRAPEIPTLDDGPGGPLQLLDPRTGKLEMVSPHGRPARMYVCGITPYDATHLGHANTYVAFDTLHRTWLDAGLEVRYVQNVTDVDDPLLERAQATGVDWRELAAGQIQLFRDDMEALRVVPPHEWVGAVESIPEVVDLVDELRERGLVYAVDGEFPDLYVDNAAIEGFGSQSGLDHEEQLRDFAERGGDPERPGKKHPLDQLVWRVAREDDPSWQTSLGEGRPGWHVECAAIALNHLGETYDVLGGGSDLAFPHHEMSVALVQGSRSLPTPVPVHGGMVGLDGEKMSKSKGNLVLVSGLRKHGVDPMVIRLVLLAHHFREDWSFDEDQLAVAQNRLDRYRAACERATAAPAAFTLSMMREGLRRDLDTPVALSAVDAWAEKAGDDPAAPGEIRAALDALLGLAW